MADTIRKNKNNTLRKALPKEEKGTYKTTLKYSTSICVEGTGEDRKLIFKHDGIKDCIPLPAEWGGGGWITSCAWVANCIANNSEVATAILNFLATNNIVFGWDITFQDNDVTFNNSDVNFTNNTELNYESTTISNHNGDTINNNNNVINNDGNVINNTDNTINYDSSTVNSTDTTYNHDGDTVNYDDSTINNTNTNINGGTYTDVTLYNPTIVGGSGAEIFWFNEDPISGWAPGLVITLTKIPLWDVVLSTVGGLIAIEPTDYTHTLNSTQVTINMDTTWEDILVSYVVSQWAVNTELVNEVIAGWASNTLFPLLNEPLGDIMVSIKGWVIQLEPTDYTHTAGDDEFTMLIDTTWLEIIVTYLKDTTLQQSKQSDWNETDNTKQSFIKNKPTIPTDVSQLTDTTNLLWGTITPAVVSSPTHNATVGEYVLVEHLANTTINLPPAQEGKQIRIKKFTGEDVFQVTINPNGSELIDGYTAVSMSINRTMYTFTGISGNRYLGD